MKKNGSIEKYLDSIGEKSSNQRLEVIATINLGARSEAARRVCEKRFCKMKTVTMYRYRVETAR